jgi:hypothetical protein
MPFVMKSDKLSKLSDFRHMNASSVLIQAIPSIAQSMVIGSGFLREIIKHTVRYNTLCKAAKKAERPNFPCMRLVAARVHRFIAVLGLALTALASTVLSSNVYIRGGSFAVFLAASLLYGKYIIDEPNRMEKTPQSWYDGNKEFVFSLVYAAIGITIAVASQ